MIISSPHDFRRAAQRRLPSFLFDYLDGGAGAEVTLARNMDELQGIRLPQRVLADVSSVDTRVELFGRSFALPVILAPIGILGLYRRRGEVQAARAAAAAAIPFCLSTVSLCSLEEVRSAAAGPLWFQLYVIRDRGFMRDLLRTAKQLGAEALVFTVDMPVPGARYRDARSGLSGPAAPLRRAVQVAGHPRWAWDVGVRGRPHVLGNLAPVLRDASGLSDFMGWLGANFDPTITWNDIQWVRDAWDGPLIIKGILDVSDARSAAMLGADGIIVSNHGGRQLDGAASTISVLPRIAEAVGDQLTVLADSGVRSGTDVLRMLDHGARGVLLGRAFVYALAAGGEAGVTRLLDLIAGELRTALALTGRNRLV